MSEMSGKSGKVYVANVTAQNHTLNFSLPNSRKPYGIGIPMGQQKMIGDLSAPEVDALVEQLGPYGLAEVGHELKKEKLTFIFNVGSPVTMSVIQRIYDRNRGILKDEGHERRKLSAVSANATMNTDDTPIKNMTVDVEEIDPGDLGSDSDDVREGFNIDNEANTSENRRPRRRGRSN